MSEKNYVINVKTKAGTIFTVRGDTAEELTSNINSVLNAQIPDFIGGLEEALLGVTHSTPVAVVSPPPASAVDLVTAIGGTVVAETPRPAFAPVPPPAVPVSAPSLAGQRMCNHGPMTVRKGVGAKGEWKGYFCPTPKGTPDQCQPQWLTKKDPEWASV